MKETLNSGVGVKIQLVGHSLFSKDSILVASKMMYVPNAVVRLFL
jgi:hypothetical protein